MQTQERAGILLEVHESNCGLSIWTYVAEQQTKISKIKCMLHSCAFFSHRQNFVIVILLMERVVAPMAQYQKARGIPINTAQTEIQVEECPLGDQWPVCPVNSKSSLITCMPDYDEDDETSWVDKPEPRYRPAILNKEDTEAGDLPLFDATYAAPHVDFKSPEETEINEREYEILDDDDSSDDEEENKDAVSSSEKYQREVHANAEKAKAFLDSMAHNPNADIVFARYQDLGDSQKPRELKLNANALAYAKRTYDAFCAPFRGNTSLSSIDSTSDACLYETDPVKRRAMFQKWLDCGFSPIRRPYEEYNRFGLTTAFRAALLGFTEILEACMDAGYSLNEVVDPWGRSLRFASYVDGYSFLQTFLDKHEIPSIAHAPFYEVKPPPGSLGIPPATEQSHMVKLPTKEEMLKRYTDLMTRLEEAPPELMDLIEKMKARLTEAKARIESSG